MGMYSVVAMENSLGIPKKAKHRNYHKIYSAPKYTPPKN